MYLQCKWMHKYMIHVRLNTVYIVRFTKMFTCVYIWRKKISILSTYLCNIRIDVQKITLPFYHELGDHGMTSVESRSLY